jgi:hypothetical protein
MGDVDLALLEKRLATEDDADVRHSLELAAALKRLVSGTPEEIEAALETLGGNLDPSVLSALTTAREQATDPGLRAVIDKAMTRIQTRISC